MEGKRRRRRRRRERVPKRPARNSLKDLTLYLFAQNEDGRDSKYRSLMGEQTSKNRDELQKEVGRRWEGGGGEGDG